MGETARFFLVLSGHRGERKEEKQLPLAKEEKFSSQVQLCPSPPTASLFSARAAQHLGTRRGKESWGWQCPRLRHKDPDTEEAAPETLGQEDGTGDRRDRLELAC